jgi:hypothetical protein
VDGRFVLTNVAPGRYSLTAAKNGFVQSAYGQRGNARQGTPLTVAPKQHLKDLAFNLTPAGVITGRVLNEDGEPMPYVRITPLRQAYVQGRRQYMPTGGSTTDDRGEYRVFGLPPGKYFVSANYGSRGPDTDDDERYVPIYYPGAIDPTRAAALEVAAGAEVRGIDFALMPTATARVRGKVMSGVLPPGARVSVQLLPRNPGMLAFMGRPNRAEVQRTGDFEIRGVVPGSYMLAADHGDDGRRYSARMPVEVGPSGLDNIILTITEPPRVSGTVRTTAQGVAMNSLRLYLSPRETGGFTGGGQARVKADGSFLFENAGRDHFNLNVSGLPEGYYLKSARLGDIDVIEHGLDLSKGFAGALDVIVSPGAGVLEGAVTKEGQAAGGVTVALVPEGSGRTQPRLYSVATTDQNGRYMLKGLTPGDYKMFAWEDIEPGAYQDPDFLKPYESSGKSITIRENSREVIDLTVLRPSSS